MSRKMSFKSRILFNFSVIIALFSAGIILLEKQQFENERIRSLERMLESNADIIYRYIGENNIDLQREPERIREMLGYMTEGIRFTLIDQHGSVLFDNEMDATAMDNHLKRREVQKSIGASEGSAIRVSTSDNIKHLYYAKKYEEGFFIRLAIPYDVKLQLFLAFNNSFIIYILSFSVVCALMVFYFSNRFSKSLKDLREFSLNIKNGLKIPNDFVFADDEIGEISADIMERYNLLQENRRKLAAEREKLLQHFQLSEEGIAIFSTDRKKIYANSHFLQFLNVLLDTPTLEIKQLFDEPVFGEFLAFLNAKNREGNVFSKRIEKNGRQFNVRLIIFEDESFEFYISDITKSEKTRLLKQEMTNNIAHELRTPVTSIRGYLETIVNLYGTGNNERIPGFLERAYMQAVNLSELIQDIGMLTKIEEASDRFEMEQVRINELLHELGNDLADKLNEAGDRFTVEVSDNVEMCGSRTLLYAIFRNLIENSLSYGGENIDIVVRCYNENRDDWFFELYDTGTGVEEKHLVRIFERFYRVNEGRTRITGGTGLGLSVVRNAVLFHKGSIIARNRPGGGLSFLMTFPKHSK